VFVISAWIADPGLIQWKAWSENRQFHVLPIEGCLIHNTVSLVRNTSSMSIHSTPITGRNPDYASNLSFTISPYIFRAPHSLRPLTGTPNPPVVEGYSALTLRAFLTKLTLIRQHSPVRDEFVFSILSSYQFFFLIS